jgi:hypothetical protein
LCDLRRRKIGSGVALAVLIPCLQDHQRGFVGLPSAGVFVWHDLWCLWWVGSGEGKVSPKIRIGVTVMMLEIR